MLSLSSHSVKNLLYVSLSIGISITDELGTRLLEKIAVSSDWTDLMVVNEVDF
jgi:hypothetical protein